MEFCTMDQVRRFLEVAPEFEKAIVESGILLIKYWLEVSPEEQTRRLEARIDDPSQDLETVANGPEVLQPMVRLFPGPRRHVQGDRHPLGPVACCEVRRQEARAAQCDHAPSVADPLRGAAIREVVLPKRQKPHGYTDPNYPYKIVPEREWAES